MSTSLRRVLFLTILVALILVPAVAAAFQVTSGSVTRDKRLVSAGEEGAQLKFTSGLTLELSPHSKLRQHKDADLWMDADGKTATEVFTLVQGRVHVHRPRIEGQRRVGALVRTSRKLMAVTTAGEMTAIAESERGVVASYVGTALLSTGGGWKRLTEGRFATVTRSVPAINFQKLPSAPAIEASRRLWISLQEKARVGGFKWGQAKAGAQFRVSVRDVTTSADVVVETLSQVQLDEDALTLGPGDYEIRVQSINDYGLAGPYSEPSSFRVVGVRTHRGARLDKRGTLHLGANQRAEFLFVDGLLMAYGSASRWAPATASVPLYDQQPTSIHFRLPNSSEIVSARLEPRGVVADVYVGSKLARWPGDTVEVVVSLRDESGELKDSAIEPNIAVTLGIEPLELDWTRVGSTLRAKITPRGGPGPWVVRATVTDQHGVELGRDFLEIAERSVPKPKPSSKPPAGAVKVPPADRVARVR